jgi:hypothetical protein
MNLIDQLCSPSLLQQAREMKHAGYFVSGCGIPLSQDGIPCEAT